MKQNLNIRTGYLFNDNTLLLRALTHCSSDTFHNERLEFLGDVILNFIVSDALYHRFPKVDEGDMSRMRSTLVCSDTLADFGRQLQVDKALNLGFRNKKYKSAQYNAIIADAMESMIGAIYLDSNIEQTRRTILRWYKHHLLLIKPGASQKDPKTRLQEYLQEKKKSLPAYVVICSKGKAHNRTFTVLCDIQGMPKSMIGKGNSRRKAEQAAAAMACRKLIYKNQAVTLFY